MGFFKRIAGLLGLSKDDSDDESDDQPRTQHSLKDTGLPRKGFSVTKQVVVDCPQLGPVVSPSTFGDGGVQGLRWYAKRLRIDEDGDVADEFLDEVSPETTALPVDNHTRFKLKYSTRPVKVKRQLVADGKLQQYVEHQGRLQWV